MYPLPPKLTGWPARRRLSRALLGVAGMVAWASVGIVTGAELAGTTPQDVAKPLIADEEAIAVFEVSETSVADAIDLLARACSLNILFEPVSGDTNSASSEQGLLSRSVHFRYEDVTARDAVAKLAPDQGLTLLWDPQTGVGHVLAGTSGKKIEAFTRLLSDPLPGGVGSTNILPAIDFEETPLPEIFQALIREAALNVTVDPVVDGRAASPGGRRRTPPKLDLHLVNLTGLQALRSLAFNQGCVVVWNPATTVARITTQEWRAWELNHPLDPTPPIPAPPAGTNIESLIFLDEAPLVEVLEPLFQQLQLNVLFDPALSVSDSGAGQPAAERMTAGGKFRNVSLKQALLALLENEGLALAWDVETTVGRVLTQQHLWEEQHAKTRNPAPLPQSVSPSDAPGEISLEQLPLDVAMLALGRMAGINMLLAPEITTEPGRTSGPASVEVTLTLANVTARQALLGLMANYGFILVWDEETRVGRVLTGQRLESDAAAPAISLEGLPPSAPLDPSPPSFLFEDLLLPNAILMLAERAGWKGQVDGDAIPGARAPDGKPVPWPRVEARFEGVTARQALLALLRNYHLAPVWDSQAQSLRVKAAQ